MRRKTSHKRKAVAGHQRTIRQVTRDDAQAAINFLQDLLDDHDCPKTPMSVVDGARLAAAGHVLVHANWTRKSETDGGRVLEQLMDLKERNTEVNPLALFRAFLVITLVLAEDVVRVEVMESKEGKIDHHCDNSLSELAAQIGETVRHDTNLSHIAGKAGNIVQDNSGRLIFSLNCATPYVANTVEEIVAGVLHVIPEARRTTPHGHTEIKFNLDHTNSEAVRWARRLKDQPGPAVQLPLVAVDGAERVN